MKKKRRFAFDPLRCAFLGLLFGSPLTAQNTNFHNAPASVKTLDNPYPNEVLAGRQFFQSNCSSCHGTDGDGSGNVPSLNTPKVKSAAAGELYWFITKGDINNGMPSWAQLPARTRWQIVSFVRALGTNRMPQDVVSVTVPEASAPLNAPPPKPL